jgi:uncharacterized protein DUF3485
MKQHQYLVAVLLAVGLTVASGTVIGKMSNRWGPSQDSLAAARKLEEFPEEFGNWKLRSSERMSDDVVEMLECSGHFSRVYANQESGEVVNVAVTVGPSGPIAVHTPEVCFSSRAHKTLESRKSTAVGDSDDQFWATTFESNDLNANLIRVYYGWTPGDHWAATENPRVSLAWCPYLYKIQLASHLPAGTDLTSNDPCKNFLEDFIPVMKEHLIDCSDAR